MLRLIESDDTLSVEFLRTDEMVEDAKTEHGLDIDSLMAHYVKKQFNTLKNIGMTGDYRVSIRISRTKSNHGIIIEPGIVMNPDQEQVAA